MPSVLVLGIDPAAVPGIDAAGIRAALDAELKRFGEYGLEAAMTLVGFDESTGAALVAALEDRPWDVVVIGGGIRKPEPLLEFFEQVVNLVREYSPQAAIAFNTGGGDSVEAALRWVSSESE